MKNALLQHIKQIFEVLQINTEYFVYDTADDLLPGWLHEIPLTHEFVICCKADFEKRRLQEFIHKEIFKAGNWYYWFEGETRKVVEQQPASIIVEPLQLQPKENLKTSTRLPSWLDNFIFSTLHAEYAPDFQKFEYNLNLQHKDNQKYLGTYFPRSYAETFCIFDNLFCNETLKSKYARLTEVSILSVGCGTGGDIMGLLTILNKHFSSINKVNVLAVDGNYDALNILSQIIERFNSQFCKNVVITTMHVVFDKISPIGIKDSFDFIITSKMINEIINKGNGRLDNSYYDFAKTYTPLTKENGVLTILDVTTKVGASEFCPILLNRQVNRFVYENPEFVSIIPIPCAEKDNCQVQCFSQKEFTVSHSRLANDKSRVAYRILVKKVLSQELHLGRLDTQYQIQPDRFCGQGSLVADGFFLPNVTHVASGNAVNEAPIETTVEQSFPKQNVKELTADSAKVIELSKEEEKSCPQQSKQSCEAYLIDTNAFIYAPNIIEKIAEEYPIFVSAKVVDELDHRKDVTSGNDKKKAQKALKAINMAITNGRVQTITSDARLLPVDFDRRSPDNLILSVALKLKKQGYMPILVTSDNGFRAKAKILNIKTIPYTKVKSKI